MSYVEMKDIEFKLTLIVEHALRNKKKQFTCLAHLLNEKFLKECFING